MYKMLMESVCFPLCFAPELVITNHGVQQLKCISKHFSCFRSKEDVNTLMKATNHIRDYLLLYLLFETGMRIGEITGLRWEDIDLENGMIEVNHTLVYYNHAEGGSYFSVHTPKTKAGECMIPMLEEVKEAFLVERRYQEFNGRFDGLSRSSTGPPSGV